MMMLKSCVQPLLLAAAAGSAGLALGDRSSDPTVVIKDAAGRERVRLGRLGSDDAVFGLEVLGSAGDKRITLQNEEGRSTIKIVGASGIQLECVADSELQSVVLGDPAGWHVEIMQSDRGDLQIAHRDGKKEPAAELVSEVPREEEAGTVTAAMNSHGGESIGFGVDGTGARVVLSRDGEQGAVISTKSGVGSFLQLGKQALGMYLQAAVGGAVLIELSNGRPAVLLQTTPKGTGLAVDHSSGAPAIRLGIDANGVVKDEKRSKDGQVIPKRDN